MQSSDPGHLSSYPALSWYGLWAVHSLVSLCLTTTSYSGSGVFPGFWGSMAFLHAPILSKGSGNKNKERFSKYDGFSKVVSNMSPDSELAKKY